MAKNRQIVHQCKLTAHTDDWKFPQNTWELSCVTGNCYRVTCMSFKISANWLEISKLHVTTLHVAVGCTCCSSIFRSKPIFVSHVCSRFASISDDLQVSGDNLQWLWTSCRCPKAIFSNFAQFSSYPETIFTGFRRFSGVKSRFRTVCRCPESNFDHFQHFTGDRRWFTVISDSLQFLEAISSNFGWFPSVRGWFPLISDNLNVSGV